MTRTLPLRGVHLLAVLAAAALALALLPAVGGNAQVEQPDGGQDEVLPEQEEDPQLPEEEQEQQQLPQQEGDEPRVTGYEGETGTIVERSGDGLLPSFRYRGVGRHDTARLIATDNQTFRAQDPEAFRGSDHVLVARADDFPDSLAGSTLAGAVTAPVLLVDTTGDIQSDTQTALDTIQPSTVFVLGGTEAISDQVAGDLEALEYVDSVERIAGATRYETARDIAVRAAEQQPVPQVGQDTVALLATGEVFADALTGGQVAYGGPFPLLLTPTDSLSDAAEEALTELDIDRVLVLGGSAAVSDDVVATLEGQDVEVERLAGRDRTVTAVEIAEFAISELGFSENHVSVARGNEFPDALAIAPHAGEEQTPLLISATQNELGQPEVAEFLLARGCTAEDLHVSGGFVAISPEDPALEQEFRQAATGPACDLQVVTDDQSVDTGEEVQVEADVLNSLGEPSTGGIPVSFATEAQVGGDDAATCEPQQAETNDSGRAACTFQTEEEGLYEVTATVVTTEGEEVSDSALIGVGAGFEPGATGQTFEFPVASVREVGQGFEDSPNPLGAAGGDGQGLAQLTVDEATGEVCLQFTAFNTAGDFSAFETASGQASVGLYEAVDPQAPADLEPFAINNREGEPAVGFGQTPEPDPAGTVVYEEVCETADASLIQSITDTPGEFYLNAHTDAWPGGNVRGQIDGSWDGTDRSDEQPSETDGGGPL
jgi:putative cell wall-binding protein